MSAARMRPTGRAVLFTVMLAVAMGTFMPAARSDCAAPAILLSAEGPFEPGDAIRIRGEDWTGDCNDVITCSVGCLGERCTGGEAARPATAITLRLQPATGETDGGTVLVEGIDADEDLRFDATFTMPEVPAGRYRIVGTSEATSGWSSEAFRVASTR
jgi:hypothetical protein